VQGKPLIFSVIECESNFSGMDMFKECEIESLVASSPLCDSVLVEIRCINVRRNTTVF
jgi:hypothetical protein